MVSLLGLCSAREERCLCTGSIRTKTSPSPWGTGSVAQGSLLSMDSHTLRIRGAGAWKMAEGLGVNFFLTSGTWKPAPGLPSHLELWVVMTVVGFTFVDLDGFTPVQAWNSCLEQRTHHSLAQSHPLP